MQFIYRGRDSAGAIVTNTIVAATKSEAINAIRDTGVTPFSLTEKKAFSFQMKFSLFNRVTLSEKIMFVKNLAGMLRAGLPLSRALEVLRKQVTTNNYFQSILTALIATIDGGGSLSDGLARYPKVFSSLVVSMVRAGEESGSVPGALNEIGINLEKSFALNRKIKSALMYPSIIVCVIILIGILMFIYVVPTLIKTFKELNVQLPTSTRIIVWLSDTISNHLPLIVLGLGVLVVAIVAMMRLPRTKRMIDFVILRLPLLGTLIKEINTARTTRTLASLLASGVRISRAITITKEVLQHVYYKELLTNVERSVERGEPMSATFKAHTALYPVMVGEMMEVGEETGKLSSMLLDIAVFYEETVDVKTKNLSTIIEPVLMVLVGAAVGFFAVSMLSPIYSIVDTIK